jgi:hypothetical protein
VHLASASQIARVNPASRHKKNKDEAGCFLLSTFVLSLLLKKRCFQRAGGSDPLHHPDDSRFIEMLSRRVRRSW